MVTTYYTTDRARGCTSVNTSVRLSPGLRGIQNEQVKKCIYTICVTCKHTKYVGPHVRSSYVMIPCCENCPNDWVLQSNEDELPSDTNEESDMTPDEMFKIITEKMKKKKRQTTQEIPTRNVDETVQSNFPGWFRGDIFTESTKEELASAKDQVMRWLFNGNYHGKSFLGSYMKIQL